MISILVLLATAQAGYPDCESPVDQTSMTICAGRKYQAADAKMAAQWKQTYAYMKRMDAQDTSRGGGFGYAAALLASQRMWLKFRDAECVIEGGRYAGGTAQPMATSYCRERLTEARTQQLRELAWRR